MVYQQSSKRHTSLQHGKTQVGNLEKDTIMDSYFLWKTFPLYIYYNREKSVVVLSDCIKWPSDFSTM